MQPKEKIEQSIQSIDQALGEIERTLEQMLALERLQRKIDRIADTI